MKKFISFACACCIFGASTALAQAVSKAPASDPFRIDRGSSFSASVAIQSAPTETPSRTPAIGIIISDLREALEIIHLKHADGGRLKDGELTKSSVNAMLAELDPHSSYYDPAEFSELLGEQDSEYSGTGSTISNFVRNGTTETYVLSTHPDSSAAKANLQYGDRIVAVDGVPVSGLSSEIVRDKVRGPRGTTVHLTIERALSNRVEVIQLRRERVFQPTLPNYFIVRDGVGYIDLSEGFSHTTSAEFAAAIKELHRRGMTSLVLDLRGNTGGILDQAVKVAEEFLPAGATIISQRGRSVLGDRKWRSTNRDPENMPLVVVVNEQTASASEVVAGALQDNDRAIIIGQNTFGKGLVQNVVGLPMGSGLTLTTARYYTPSGRSIQRSYESSGMYDYFNHRRPANGIDQLRSEAHTITNRIVYGGNGIAPDESLESPTFTAKKAALLDPIFFFVRDLLHTKNASPTGSMSTREQIRQSIIFGKTPVNPVLLESFTDYAMRTKNNVSAQTIRENRDFISGRLNYELALATFGPGSAKHAQIDSDGEILKAIEALPKAARLAVTAQRERISTSFKKTRRVAFPTGQVRNRRN